MKNSEYFFDKIILSACPIEHDYHELCQIARRLSPQKTLSILSTTFLFQAVDEDFCYERFGIAQLDFLQFVFACFGSESNSLLPTFEDLNRVIELTLEIFLKIEENYELLAAGKHGEPSHEPQAVFRQFRLHAAFYRNWGYFEETIEITEGIIEPIQRQLGQYGAPDIQLFIEIVKHLSTSNQLSGKIQELFRDNFQLRSIDRKSLLMELSKISDDIDLMDLFIIDVNKLASQLKRTPQSVTQLLSLLCHKWGEVEDKYQFSAILNNPIVLRPVTRLSNSDFLIFNIPSILSFILDIIKRLLDECKNSAARKCFDERKGRYLEQKTEKIFKQYLSCAKIFPNAYITYKTQQEKDLIVVYGDILLIVEAKSKLVQESERRGSVEKTITYIEKTIIKAHSQTRVISEALQNGGTLYIENKKSSFRINPNQIRRIYRIVMLLCDLGNIGTNYRNLIEATGDMGRDIGIFGLSDIITVFKTLDSSSERIDYLLQRSLMEEKIHYAGDEMDILGLYLKNRLRFDFDKYRNGIGIISGKSMAIDQYRMKKQLGVPCKKPSVKISPYWKSLVHEIEKRVGGNSQSVTNILFNVNYTQQLQCAEKIEIFRKEIKFHIPPSIKFDGLIGLCNTWGIFFVVADLTSGRTKIEEIYDYVIRHGHLLDFTYSYIFVLDAYSNAPYIQFMKIKSRTAIHCD